MFIQEFAPGLQQNFIQLAIAQPWRYQWLRWCDDPGVGKTYAGAGWVLDRALQRPDLTGLIVARTHEHLNHVLLPMLAALCDRVEIALEPASIRRIASQEYCHLGPGRARVRVMVSQDKNRMALRGLRVGWIWLDEPDLDEDQFWALDRCLDGKGLITETVSAPWSRTSGAPWSRTYRDRFRSLPPTPFTCLSRF